MLTLSGVGNVCVSMVTVRTSTDLAYCCDCITDIIRQNQQNCGSNCMLPCWTQPPHSHWSEAVLITLPAVACTLQLWLIDLDMVAIPWYGSHGLTHASIQPFRDKMDSYITAHCAICMWCGLQWRSPLNTLVNEVFVLFSLTSCPFRQCVHARVDMVTSYLWGDIVFVCCV